MINLLPGDCINTRNTGAFVSNMIRKFGRAYFPDYDGPNIISGARFSHTAMALGDGLCIESLWRVRINPVSKYDNQECVVWRIPDATILEHNPGKTPMQIRESVSKHTLMSAGDGYGIFKIPLFALDYVFQTYFFTSKLGFSSFKVCSNLYAYAWSKYGNIDFGVNWRSVSPDYLDDWFVVKGQTTPVYSNLKKE